MRQTTHPDLDVLLNRQIFFYYDGVRQRSADPTLLHKKMWGSDDCDPAVDFPLATGQDEPDPPDEECDDATLAARQQERVDAQERLLRLIKEMFDCPDYDETTGQGLTINEQIDLFVIFFVYLNELKKKRNQLRTQLQRSEQESSTNGNGTTQNSVSDSNSTQTASNSGEE